MASLGKLAATVAHEINNPLTGISTYARLLRRKLADQGDGTAVESAGETENIARESARVLKLIDEEAARCGNIVKNLLLFSRTPAARYTEHDLQPLLERCVLLLKHQAELQEVGLRLDVGVELPRLSCDSSQIQQMILALAMNAIEATPPGGEVTISAREQDSGEGLVLEVSDSGRGIAAEHLDKIFEPFFTTKEGANGVGLGLAVVYGIVSRHHGTVDVKSSPGSGTVVTIHLPLSQPPAQDTPTGNFEEVTS
jgi:two-component system NtrC family sensor kinase